LEARVRRHPVAPAQPAPEVHFAVQGGGVLDHAVVPTLRFSLRAESHGGQPIRSLALNVQLRIAATARRYDDRAQARLVELFGYPEQWGRTLRSLHWTNLTLQVPPFEGSTAVELTVPCTYDFEVTASRYLDALEDGDVPLEFLFSGTVFYLDPSGLLRVGRVSWDEVAEFRLPVAAWREMMDRYFPNSAWLRLGKESFDRLYAYRARRALPSWEHAIDALLREAGPE
jgi:Family of unknown function (DUF6084)